MGYHGVPTLDIGKKKDGMEWITKNVLQAPFHTVHRRALRIERRATKRGRPKRIDTVESGTLHSIL